MLKIVPYKETWPAEFLTIASALRAALGKEALRIDHIGSTSVPGLAAKDVIDIQITVQALTDHVKSTITGLGYIRSEGISGDHRPPQMVETQLEWTKWFFSQPAGQRRTNLHVRMDGRANQRYPLLFRDYLRAHPPVAEAYAELKRRLAKNLADPDTYP